MITGDHPRTALRIAIDLGIVDETAQAVTGVELDSFNDADFAAATLLHYSVFARVAPKHKLRIVKALQNARNVVAMTGDGVNDAPALKAADIGVAMGVTGTEVSKEAARMILTDDNFATIVMAVREGRGVLDNIRKTSATRAPSLSFPRGVDINGSSRLEYWVQHEDVIFQTPDINQRSPRGDRYSHPFKCYLNTKTKLSIHANGEIDAGSIFSLHFFHDKY